MPAGFVSSDWTRGMKSSPSRTSPRSALRKRRPWALKVHPRATMTPRTRRDASGQGHAQPGPGGCDELPVFEPQSGRRIGGEVEMRIEVDHPDVLVREGERQPRGDGQ